MKKRRRNLDRSEGIRRQTRFKMIRQEQNKMSKRRE